MNTLQTTSPNVSAAAAPFPPRGAVSSSLPVVTAARGYVAAGAGGCHAVGHPGSGDSIRVSCLAASCGYQDSEEGKSGVKKETWKTF